MDYKAEFEKLFDAAKQAIDCINFTEKTIHSFSALWYLRDTVESYKEMEDLHQETISIHGSHC